MFKFILNVTILLMIFSIFTTVIFAVNNPNVDQTRTPEGYGEASELAPLPASHTERIMSYWGIGFVLALLILAVIVYLIRPKV